MSFARDSGNLDRGLSFHESLLRSTAWTDINRKGLANRVRARFGYNDEGGESDDVINKVLVSKQPLNEQQAEAHKLVKDVLGTGGGDNERLAKMMHARFDRVGLKQPSVEVRFDDLCMQADLPQGSEKGLFTVGRDLKIKALKAVTTAARMKPPMATHHILQNLTGVLKPGTITLLLGPPGGGKSLFMKALCGAAPVPTTGSVTFNGHELSEFNVVRTARYVDQRDVHNPLLTVRETLTFSAMCQGPGYNRGLLDMLEQREKAEDVTPDPQLAALMSGLHRKEDPSCNVALTLQLLSLVNCADTIVGDGALRGVSGGERKRVTTGEIVVGPSKVLFMDEISTGLDSASTFTIVQSLRNVAHATNATIVIALLQPEPQVYDLFDDVMLLSNGRIMYHGPREQAEPYFGTLGFEMPPKKAVADFLQELVSRKDQPAIRVDKSKFEPHLEFVHAAALAAAFKRSGLHNQTKARLEVPFDKRDSHPAALLKSKYGVPGWEQVKALMWREQILLGRNRQGQTYRYTQMAVLAIMGSTLFLRGEVSNTDSIRGAASVLSAVFFSMAYMQFLGLAECAETMMRLPVFYKQKYSLFFPGWAYAIPFAIIRIPIILIEVTVWSLLIYWLVGMEADAGRFFCFWGTLVIVQLYSSGLYRLLGATLRSLVLGTSTAVLVMLLTMLGSGFTILRSQLPRGWKWMFWVSPLQYAFTGLANNEFSGDSYDFPVTAGGVQTTFGRLMLDTYQFNVGNKWRWIAPVVLLAWYFGLNLLSIAALSLIPPPGQPPPPPPPEEPEYVIQDGAANTKDGAVAQDLAVHIPLTKEKSSKSRSKDLSFPFEPITLAFKELNYYVPNPVGAGELQLLRGISGVFRPHVLTALMGASGAGKTTLMDVLADRKTAGRSEGKVTVNGYDKEKDAFARVMGYCEQFDVHSPGLTVGESIRFSADLRLGKDVSHEDKVQFVEQTLDVVELDTLRDQIVGIPGMFGLSGEQFKRLTIAVELVANPSILFMDEPTSGLDARAAQIVMRVVRAIGDQNRTIVCTIHQPSTEIFSAFDELLLLQRGGDQIFYGPLGPGCQRLVQHFESVPGTIKLKKGYNPATYMLEASTQAEEERLQINFGAIWKEQQMPYVLQQVEPYMEPVADAKQLHFPSKYSQGRFLQYKALFTRYMKAYWRSPPYNTTRLILAVIAGLLVGTFYWGKGDKYDTPGDVLAIMGALFVSVSFVGFVNLQMIMPTFYMERPVMWRERASALYAVLPWVEAMEDVEIPWVAVQVTLFSVIAYFLIQFEMSAGRFFFFWLGLYLSCLNMAYLGMVMVAITPNLQMGITVAATIMAMWFAFAGFMIPKPHMPAWWEWFYYLSPPSWTLYAIVADQLGGKDQQMTADFNPEGIDQMRTVSQYIEDEFDFEHSFRWAAMGILALFVIGMRFVVSIATKTLNWQKR